MLLQKNPLLMKNFPLIDIYTKVRIESCQCTWILSGYALQQMPTNWSVLDVFLDSKRHYNPLLALSFLKMKRAKNCIRSHEAGQLWKWHVLIACDSLSSAAIRHCLISWVMFLFLGFLLGAVNIITCTQLNVKWRSRKYPLSPSPSPFPPSPLPPFPP